MNRGLGLLAVVVVLSFGLLGCGTAAAGQAPVEVSCDEFQSGRQVSREVEARAGDTIKLSLCSNPSTGFKWEEAVISDPEVLEQVDRGYVDPAAGTVGAAGKEEWTFRALKAGTASVALEYSRPWTGAEKGEWTFDLKVVAR
jgi:inhibitor of cysteine peptidase